MWSHIVICFLVGYAFASNNPAWKENSEYVYEIRGRTLAGLHEVSQQYSGIIFKSQLKIQPRSDGKLQAQISNVQYSQVHSYLENGWNSEIRDTEVSYKPLAISNHPFQIEMKDGVIRDLIVSKDLPNWEINIIKSVVSQFQLNTNGVDHLPSKLTALPHESDDDSAVFKTMEDTVTGKTETMYDIHRLPAYVLQNKPWMVRSLNLKGDGEVIEVVKHKNYSNSEDLPLYHYGFGNMKDYKPGSNYMGYFFIRNSISRAILSGNLKRYTVQNTYTVNEIVMSPSLNNKQKGAVISMVNATLEKINSKGQDLGEVPNPTPLGNLIYTYDSSKGGDGGQKGPHGQKGGHHKYRRSATLNRLRRFIKGKVRENSKSDSSSSSRSSEEHHYQGNQPQLREAPRTPLLPYSTGYKGMSIKDDPNVDIKKSVHKIAQDIGNDLQNPAKCLRQNTLNKFTTMTSLIRLLDLEELKQVAAGLYSPNQKGAQREAWIAFRDAVAECGTGPAFLTIQEWIQSDKIKEQEAAQIIATMTDAVRHPTRDYMKSYFEFIKTSKVQSQRYLNDSVLLSYTNLVSEVCVDWKESYMQFPVRSFGQFCTEDARTDIEKIVIPYFSKQLEDAVAKSDTYKIHAYIRALGNVGHQYILPAFEPYLEGKKQSSQFQRVLMVMAMDRLTQTQPKVARSVLYKIYQNSGESEKVRAAAVFQLMHTNPPIDMLQRMAAYTNIDTHEYVNAAVKSSIEYAVELEGVQYQWLRSAAEAAKPLLNKKNYGVQHGQIYLRNYVIEELKSEYKQSVQYFGNEEEFYPRGFRYAIHDELGGMQWRLANFQAMVSSVDELIHLVQYQTAEYQQQMQQQQKNAQEQKKNKFSSLNIAQLLNLQVDEREQFEGSFYTELHGSFYNFWSFNNHSMEQLPEAIRKYEEELRSGKDYHHTKISNGRDMALSFPTETGLPFLFTYDSPVYVKLEGKVQGEATPKLCQGEKLHKPETITLKAELGFTYSKKVQGRLSFTTPFDGQQYMCGFDKNLQVHVPFYANLKYDNKNQQIEMEMENKEIHEGVPIFHYSTWPYTSRVDIKNFQPISEQQNTHYIQQQNLRSYDQVFGKKTGVAFRVHIEHERQFINIPWLGHLLQHDNAVTTLWKVWEDASIQYGQINVQLQPGQSTSRKYIIRAGYQHKYISGSKQTKSPHSPDWNQLHSMPNPLERQKNLIDTIGHGINSANVYVWDASIEFQGSKNVKYSFYGGVGKSNVDSRSRVMFYYKSTGDAQDGKPYEMSLQAESQIPNTNGLDLTESLKTEPKADTSLEVKFGTTLKSCSKVEFKFEWRRSEERKLYLKEQDMYKQCQREMKEGNYQLPACANMTMAFNLLDRVKVNVQYENLEPDLVDAMRSMYETVKLYYYTTLEVDKTKGTGQKEKLEFQARFDTDLRGVNISLKVQDHQSTINTIQVKDWAQKVFVLHPVFHLPSRVIGTGLGLHTYRPICVVDQTHISTFSNQTYPGALENHWSLLLHYVPKDARHTEGPIPVEQQLQRQPENYAVLARQQSGSGQQKEVKITLSSSKTEYKVIDITLEPSAHGTKGSKGAAKGSSKGCKAKVTVDNQQITVSDQQSYDVKEGYIQIYSLPNGEVKVEIQEAFYAIYDGNRVKLTVVNGKFRDSIRGLCGAFNDDPYSDFLTPANCIAADYRHFIKSYALEGSDGQQQQQQLGKFPGGSSQCVARQVPLYVNVISDRDAGRKGRSGGSGSPSRGTRFQTRYVESDIEICFTIRPVPVCNSSSQPRGLIRKSVGVHCVQKSNVAQLWKSQIDKGASPDFSHKKESKTVHIELPQSCA